jgi:hypothetical protein
VKTVVDDIEKLVADVAKEALSGNKNLQEKMDALKLLAPYYTALKKKGKTDDEASDEPTMGELRNRLRLVEEPADDGSEQTTARRPGNPA